MDDRLIQAKQDYRWATAILGAMLSAPAVISLIQHGFHLHLNWGFQHFVEYYRGLVSPLVDIVQWPFRWVLAQLDLQWPIPQWAKDAHTLSFVLAALYVRAWTGTKGIPTILVRGIDDKRRREFERLQYEVRIGRRVSYSYQALFLLRALAFLSRVIQVAALGLTGLSILLWTNAIVNLPRKWGMLDYASETTQIRYRDYFISLLLVAIATSLATIVFYLGNTLVPQLETH